MLARSLPILAAAALAAASLAATACSGRPGAVDAMSAVGRDEVGLPILSLRWKFEVAARGEDSKPQEFASPALAAGSHPESDRLYVGSAEGVFYALAAESGQLLWKRQIGSVGSRPAFDRGRLFVGTSDGNLICLDAFDGTERWRYNTRGPILQTPVLSGDLVLFSNEADQVYALDRDSGVFRWQYKTESPEEYTLRGHAGVTLDGELLFSGFADGTVIALRASTGSVAWIKSLKGDSDRFVDADATPVVVGETVYAASSAGGVYALDKQTGLVRWHLPVQGVGAIVADDDRLYIAAADSGVYALDFGGNILWRQGTHGGGEPAEPVVSGSYLLYALSDAGLFIADKATGQVHQYFDPGFGISAQPTLAGDRMYVMSNSAILYAMGLRRF